MKSAEIFMEQSGPKGRHFPETFGHLKLDILSTKCRWRQKANKWCWPHFKFELKIPTIGGTIDMA